MRLRLDKIASATLNVPLRRDVRLGETIVAREGYIVAGRVRGEKSVYNTLEDPHGRMVPLHDGDLIAGVLGRRDALRGYSGAVPPEIRAGDTLQVLNLGGVIGQCTSMNPDLGQPFDIEILGSIFVFPDFEDRCGVPAHIGMNAIRLEMCAPPTIPVVFVIGTCMNSGKTSAACQLVRQFARRGRAVGACKLTGVSLRRDTLQMGDYGAHAAVSFTEAGIVSTSGENSAMVARTLLSHLAETGADVIVAELGDGLFGEYGVAQILADPALRGLASVLVFCANDPVGVWGGQRALSEQYGLAITVVCGPATDNDVGIRFIERQLGLAAINARTHGEQLGAFVATQLEQRSSRGAA